VRIGGKLLPSGDSNAFRQTVVFEHPRDTQDLKHDDAETSDQFSAFLMREVLPPIGDPLPFNGKGDKPFATAASAQRDRFDLTFDWPMRIDQHRAALREDEPVAFQTRAIAVLRVGHTVVAAKALEARVSGVLFSGFDTPEERLECQINANLDILQHLAMHQLERFALRFPVGKHRLGVIQPKRFLTLFPSITAQSKRLIVDKAALLKLLLKEALLAFGQMQVVLIGGCTQFGYTYTLSYKQIERKCYPCLSMGCIGLSATAFILRLKPVGFLPPFL
jgi:hypothetical protein